MDILECFNKLGKFTTGSCVSLPLVHIIPVVYYSTVLVLFSSSIWLTINTKSETIFLKRMFEV